MEVSTPQATTVMDIKSAATRPPQPVSTPSPSQPGAELVSHIPVHEPTPTPPSAIYQAPLPQARAPVQEDKGNANLDQILKEVNQKVAEVAKPQPSKKFGLLKSSKQPSNTENKRTPNSKLHIHELMAIFVAIGLIVLALKFYK